MAQNPSKAKLVANDDLLKCFPFEIEEFLNHNMVSLLVVTQSGKLHVLLIYIRIGSF
jgi:hypothetical protein